MVVRAAPGTSKAFKRFKNPFNARLRGTAQRLIQLRFSAFAWGAAFWWTSWPSKSVPSDQSWFGEALRMRRRLGWWRLALLEGSPPIPV